MGILPPQWIDYLSKQPESGPNYQLVNITTANGRSYERVLVANCQYIGESNPLWHEIDPRQIVSMAVVA